MATKQINPILKWLVPTLILVLGFGAIALFSDSASKQEAARHKSAVNNDAVADTSVETLKTVAAELNAVQTQNQQIIAENKALKAKDKGQLETFKADVLQQVHTEFENYKAQVQEPATATDNADYLIEDSNKQADSLLKGFIWVSDLQRQGLPTIKSDSVTKDGTMNSLLNPIQEESISSTDATQAPYKPKVKPFFTLPVNATLTGAIAMQPLIGRIPINGRVPDPYMFKAIIGPKNLAANGVDIPADIQGIIVGGIASGDMLGSCTRGDIISLTFVFQDGRISTTEAEKGDSLGSIAAANGNPCIAGEFHSNAPLYLGVTTGLGAIQGYANALSQAQTQSSITNGVNISTLIKDGNKYALGQAGSSAAMSAQRWWDQRVQNSFDFVYVPNIDPKSGAKLRLNINITKQIEINYNLLGRKVAYETNANTVADFD
jgi:hypothetical protein